MSDVEIMLECRSCGKDIDECTCNQTNLIMGKLLLGIWFFAVVASIGVGVMISQ